MGTEARFGFGEYQAAGPSNPEKLVFGELRIRV